MNAATTSTTEQGPHRRRAVGAFLTLALSLATIAVSATGALFTDADSHEGNTFATGTVELGQTYAGDQVLAAGDMAPGDTVSKAVTVENTGSLELRYAVTSTTTTDDDLAAQLELTVWDADTATCDTPPSEVGDTLYGPDDLGSTAGTALVGDTTPGHETGDRVLGAGADEVLCLHVELPLDTGNDHQGTSTTTTFDFLAEQTANNS